MKNMIIVVITKKAELRDWGATSFEVVGAWKDVEMAKSALEKIKQSQDEINESCGDGKTAPIESHNGMVSWSYSDFDGNYYYEIEEIELNT